jgi:hypothetical protein
MFIVSGKYRTDYMQDFRRWAAFVAIGLALFFLVARVNDARGGPPLVAGMASDFHEFYCAGDVVLEREDPYRVEPLSTCMHRVMPNSVTGTFFATPAPLPGYALALFAALATLQFPVAQELWVAFLVACVLVASLALAKLTNWSPLLMLLCLTPTVGLLNLSYGEFTPIVVCAICLGALALECGSPRVAAVCSGVAMIEPHMGLPALAALALLIPRARSWALGVAITLAAISIVAVGFNLNVEYFRAVLPLQALAEVAANDQYSLTRIVALMGASSATALLAGTASYVLMFVVGLTLARRLCDRRLAYVLLLPPAAVALGGAFIHDVQIATALPVALLLVADVPAMRTWATGAAMLLIVHVGFRGFMAYVSIVSLIAVAALCLTLPLGKSIWPRALALAVVLLITGGAYSLLPHRPVSSHSAVAAPQALPVTRPDEYASTAWGDFLRSRSDASQPSARYVLEKLPTWLGLLILLWCAFRVGSVKGASDGLRRGLPLATEIG